MSLIEIKLKELSRLNPNTPHDDFLCEDAFSNSLNLMAVGREYTDQKFEEGGVGVLVWFFEGTCRVEVMR